MSERLAYSERNKRLLSGASVIWIGLFLLWVPAFNSYTFGQLVGALVSLWLFPRVISYVVYLITGKNLAKAHMTFDIVLIIVFGLQLLRVLS